MKVMVIPVVVGELRIVPRNLEKGMVESEIWVDLRVMAMRGYAAFSKAPSFIEPYHPIV